MHDYIKIEINKEFTDENQLFDFLDLIKIILQEDDTHEQKSKVHRYIRQMDE